MKLSTKDKLNIGLIYIFNLLVDCWESIYQKTFNLQCRLYVYLAKRAKKYGISFYDLTSRVDDTELHIHKAILGKVGKVKFDEFNSLCKLSNMSNLPQQTDPKADPNYDLQDITYHMRFFTAYYVHDCVELKKFLNSFQFDSTKPINITFRLENSSKTYFISIDVHNAKNLGTGNSLAFAEINFLEEIGQILE